MTDLYQIAFFVTAFAFFAFALFAHREAERAHQHFLTLADAYDKLAASMTGEGD